MKYAAALVIVLLSTICAQAHDHARPDLNDWFKSLHSSNGYPCCSGSDSTRLEDSEWEKVCADGQCHYRVMIEKKWYDVPPEAVVVGENKSGVAQVWPYPTYLPGGDGNDIKAYSIRCFMPGVEG